MSFVALKMMHNELMYQLEDGAENFLASCAFSAPLFDNGTVKQ
jgi:hypothetical protein